MGKIPPPHVFVRVPKSSKTHPDSLDEELHPKAREALSEKQSGEDTALTDLQ